jgi:hypothetical protein
MIREQTVYTTWGDVVPYYPKSLRTRELDLVRAALDFSYGMEKLNIEIDDWCDIIFAHILPYLSSPMLPASPIGFHPMGDERGL